MGHCVGVFGFYTLMYSFHEENLPHPLIRRYKVDTNYELTKIWHEDFTVTELSYDL